MTRNRKGDQVVAVNGFTEDVEARADVTCYFHIDMAYRRHNSPSSDSQEF